MRVLLLGLVCVTACGDKAAAPDVERRVDQCLSTLEQLEDREASDLWSACPDLFREPACRDALTCRDAYCPRLPAPKPEACAAPGRAWAEGPAPVGRLLGAILHYELGDPGWRVAGPLALHFIVRAGRAEERARRMQQEGLRRDLPPDAVPVGGAARSYIIGVLLDDIWLDGKVIARTADVEAQQDDTVAALREALAGADPDAQVVIQADPEVSHAVVVKVMNTARDAGLRRIAIATHE